jgi:hypothetical protein
MLFLRLLVIMGISLSDDRIFSTREDCRCIVLQVADPANVTQTPQIQALLNQSRRIFWVNMNQSLVSLVSMIVGFGTVRIQKS